MHLSLCSAVQVITRKASMRVAEYAFNYAKDNGRAKVTAVHKANIMKLTDGLFLECCREVSQKFPEILYNEMIVDNTCMQVSSLHRNLVVRMMPSSPSACYLTPARSKHSSAYSLERSTQVLLKHLLYFFAAAEEFNLRSCITCPGLAVVCSWCPTRDNSTSW